MPWPSGGRAIGVLLSFPCGADYVPYIARSFSLQTRNPPSINLYPVYRFICLRAARVISYNRHVSEDFRWR